MPILDVQNVQNSYGISLHERRFYTHSRDSRYCPSITKRRASRCNDLVSKRLREVCRRAWHWLLRLHVGNAPGTRAAAHVRLRPWCPHDVGTPPMSDERKGERWGRGRPGLPLPSSRTVGRRGVSLSKSPAFQRRRRW